MTAIAAVGALLPANERVAIAAREIAPILNRVVLAGPPAIDLLVNDPGLPLQGPMFRADSTLQFLSTSMVDRLAVDLQKLGFSRVRRTAGGDRWTASTAAGGLDIELIQVRTDDGESSQVWLEYATLITLPFFAADNLAVRIVGAPAMLALELDAYLRSGRRVVDSEQLERAVQLVAGRLELEKECAAAPAELRTMISSSLCRLLEHDSLELLIRRAVPDAAILPAVVTRVRERIIRLAC